MPLEAAVRQIFTIGYGGRSVEDIVALLRGQSVTHLVDVRSKPFSRFSPEFNREELKERLKIDGLRYVFMGDTLGGRPTDEDCYEDGYVVYERVANSTTYRLGLEKLLEAVYRPNWTICLLCSECRPEDCHRSKLIASTLEQHQTHVWHIDEDGRLVEQFEVLNRITSGQDALFNEVFRSRGKYR